MTLEESASEEPASEESASEILKWDFDGKIEYPEHRYKSPGIYRIGPPQEYDSQKPKNPI